MVKRCFLFGQRDQTREEIIVDREHWDDEKMFSGICGMVTSRIYDRHFLEENGIKFDESVPFGEDYLFNLEAYGHAEKICYLPQLIGYHYFINSGSLVQSQSKTGEVLISYARGYKKVFDTGLKYGFYMNAIVLGLCCVIARFMIASDKLTFEDRVEIKNILEPYLEMMAPIKVSKLYSEKAVKERYDFPREVILHPENFAGGRYGQARRRCCRLGAYSLVCGIYLRSVAHNISFLLQKGV